MMLPFERPRAVQTLAPGAVRVPAWLDERAQRGLVAACREWARPPAGMHQTKVGSGVMSVRTVCLGWHWYPYRYSRTVDDHGGAAVKPFPDWLGELGRRAVSAAGLAAGYEPDVAVINYYGGAAKMGLHQDRDELSRAPIVSLSLGDTGVFRFGNTGSRGRPYTDIELLSGDLFVFGGVSRMAFHGITRIVPGTSPLPELDGRLNLTLRESGLRWADTP